MAGPPRVDQNPLWALLRSVELGALPGKPELAERAIREVYPPGWLSYRLDWALSPLAGHRTLLVVAFADVDSGWFCAVIWTDEGWRRLRVWLSGRECEVTPGRLEHMLDTLHFGCLAKPEQTPEWYIHEIILTLAGQLEARRPSWVAA